MLILSSDEEISSDETEGSEVNSSEAEEEEDEDDEEDEEEKPVPGAPELNYNYFGSDWLSLRTKLWREF
ncbi:hypothetical protein EIK77_001183 [Talaromyces pinophilus]|nr:hypothetical protein EIK77_001183 [Talaromyces pinophilus]